MKLKVFLVRLVDEPEQTLGSLQVYDDVQRLFECKVLELPWVNNQRRISRIPPGMYPVKKHQSPKFGECFWIQDVPNRDEILIHVGNYKKDTLGCILPGAYVTDIDGDGLRDVTSSGNTVKHLLKILPNEFNINVF